MSYSNDEENAEQLARILDQALRGAGMTVIPGQWSVTVKFNNRWYRIAAARTEVYEGDD
jgi:hypothetical protein